MADRRDILKSLGATAVLGLLPFRDAHGAESQLTPAQARAGGLPLTGLDAAQAATLEALGETLLPGARKAGIAHYVDAHLRADPVQSLLMIRYLDVPPPWGEFYRGGLAALDGLARARHAKPFAALDADEQTALVGAISVGQPPEWHGPPAPLFYFVTRADAIDVVYGTQAGFAALGIPYMEHILPERPW